jgi:ketosteroid isomerase-like protein
MTTQPETETAAQLAALDPQIDIAMARQDSQTLDSLLADDFIYTHSNGLSQPKAEFIAAILKRENPPRRDLTDVQAEVHGDITVTRGNLDVVYDNGRRLVFRYVRIWRLVDGSWRTISHRTLYANDRKDTESPA